MYNGYLTLDGTEVLNGARTKKYVGALLPGVEVKCDFTGLSTALGGAGYTTPAADAAPWYVSTQAPTGRFYGFMPLGLVGADDSTRELQVTELTGDGAVHSLPRHASREIQVKTLAIAADKEALYAGIAWLKDVCDNGCADSSGVNSGIHCLDRTATFFSALPVSQTATQALRSFYRVEVIQSPVITKEWVSINGAMASVEFILRAGVPWPFTEPTRVGTLTMDTSPTTQTDAAGEDCSAATDPYYGFVNDPYFTAISKPPAPPNIKPPNILTVSSWKRKVLALPVDMTRRAGKAVPVIRVLTGTNDLQQVRIRFYETTGPLSGCGYSGEFMISYAPVNSSLMIDGIRQEITVLLEDGRRVPAGHLVYGADGKPFMWADLDCHKDYTMTVDMMTGNTGLSVILDLYVRD